jgi:uncharacterized protein (DUF1501 family)
MNRRDFLALTASLGATLMSSPLAARAADSTAMRGAPGYDNLLILVELKGGNDGLNTVIPYADPTYYSLRPKLGIPRAQVAQLDERTGLHPSLQSMVPIWNRGELAIVQGVSYPAPNLSHFRSIEIWDTGSSSDEFLRQGWLTRAFAQRAVPRGFAADGVVIGSAELGPLSNGARAIALVNPEQFLRQSRLAMPARIHELNPSLEHILSVENDIVKAADQLRPHEGQYAFKTRFPSGAFGASVKTAMEVLAATDTPDGRPIPEQGVGVIRLTLNGFDTHQNQLAQQANLLKQLSDGMVAMRSALSELGRWQSTLIMTYAEFGRRPRENQSAGTDHGTVAPHFVSGGRVRGGLYGVPPMLARLDGSGNLPVGVDFRSLYATVLERWWGLNSAQVLEQRFEPMPILRT